MRIANDTCEVMVGEVERPDTIMILGETDWLAFVEGTLDPVNACMMGKLKVTSDVLFAARLQALFAGTPALGGGYFSLLSYPLDSPFRLAL